MRRVEIQVGLRTVCTIAGARGPHPCHRTPGRRSVGAPDGMVIRYFDQVQLVPFKVVNPASTRPQGILSTGFTTSTPAAPRQSSSARTSCTCTQRVAPERRSMSAQSPETRHRERTRLRGPCHSARTAGRHADQRSARRTPEGLEVARPIEHPARKNLHCSVLASGDPCGYPRDHLHAVAVGSPSRPRAMYT
jgi:hypothetical protein